MAGPTRIPTRSGRLLEGLPGPRKGLIGPWGHSFPDEARPGPQIGFLQECLRFWDQCLKGIDTGVLEEPMLRVWMQEWTAPSPAIAHRPGRWIAEQSWPPDSVTATTLALGVGTLEDTPGPETRLAIRGAQDAGTDAGVWCAYGTRALPPELPPDQRRDDGLSLTFTSAPLSEPLEIFGFPEVTLDVDADRANALVAVRLCDVAPDGTSLLVTRGLLNLTHREGHDEPMPLAPGRRYTVTVRLNGIAQVVATGHRLRVAVSPTYWPFAWPSPEVVELGVFTGSSRLDLPVRAPRDDDARLTPFGAPEVARPLEVEVIEPGRDESITERDQGSGVTRSRLMHDAGTVRLVASELESFERSVFTYAVTADDPLSASVHCAWTRTLRRGDWSVRVETTSLMTADREAFWLTNSVDAYEGETRVSTRSTSTAIPRDGV